MIGQKRQEKTKEETVQIEINFACWKARRNIFPDRVIPSLVGILVNKLNVFK